MFLHPDHLQKLSKLRTPEDIARWREERKANFPTRQKREASTVASTVASSTEGQQTSDQLESGQQAIVVDNHNQSRADKSKHQDRSKFKRNNDFRSPNGKRRNVPTLYEKMMLADIGREEGRLFKLIEMIVEQNFLQSNDSDHQQ